MGLRVRQNRCCVNGTCPADENMRTQHGSKANSSKHVGKGRLSQCHELLLWWRCPVLPTLLCDFVNTIADFAQ